MRPLAAPGTDVNPARGSARPQADATYLRNRFLVGGNEKGSLPFYFVGGFALRRRPKGFPIALWKPSSTTAGGWAPQEIGFLWGKEGASFLLSVSQEFRLCGGDQRAFRSPFETFGDHPLKRMGTARNRFLVQGKGRSFLASFCFAEDFASAEATKKAFSIALWKPSATTR